MEGVSNMHVQVVPTPYAVPDGCRAAALGVAACRS